MPLAADLVVAADNAKLIQVFVRCGLALTAASVPASPSRRGHAQGEGAHLLR
jgi:enoyl-CoA hydratase/carnithine racemase